MNEEELRQAQGLIDKLAIGDKRCVKEIYGQEWGSIVEPKVFGKQFKRAVLDNRLRNLTRVGIRNAGRCDEYERT
jgi:hypothetical protein